MSDEDTLVRLVKLETAVKLKFEEMDKALILARELACRDKENATEVLDRRLESMNEFRAQMNKQEATYATRNELRAVERLVYIGIGIILAFEVLIRFVKF